MENAQNKLNRLLTQNHFKMRNAINSLQKNSFGLEYVLKLGPKIFKLKYFDGAKDCSCKPCNRALLYDRRNL